MQPIDRTLNPCAADSSALKDMRDLITEGVHKSDTLVLLATGGVLTRPWCLLELLETKRKRIPVISEFCRGYH